MSHECIKKYIRFEFQERKYSSNAIKGIYIHIDEKGIEHEKYDLLFSPFPNKEKGDQIGILLLNYLNSLL